MNDTSKSVRPSRWPYTCAACGRGFDSLPGFDGHRKRGNCVAPTTGDAA